jgi:hypothetical protein
VPTVFSVICLLERRDCMEELGIDGNFKMNIKKTG